MKSMLYNLFFKVYYLFIRKSVNLVKPEKSDFDLISNLFIEGINNKVYEKDLISNKSAFEYSITSMLSGEFIPDQYGRKIKTLICTYGNERVGFLCLAHNEQKKEIEIWYFSILEKYQNCGIGKKITKNVVDELSGVCKLHARCSQNSKQMIKILKLYGFKETGENKKGYKFFYL